MLGEVKEAVAQRERGLTKARAPRKSPSRRATSRLIGRRCPPTWRSRASPRKRIASRVCTPFPTWPLGSRACDCFPAISLNPIGGTIFELCVFSGGTAANGLRFDRFRELFSSVFSREDLARDADVAALFAMELDQGSPATRDEFVAWALKAAREDMDPGRLERLLRRVLAEAPNRPSWRLDAG